MGPSDVFLQWSTESRDMQCTWLVGHVNIVKAFFLLAGSSDVHEEMLQFGYFSISFRRWVGEDAALLKLITESSGSVGCQLVANRAVVNCGLV